MRSWGAHLVGSSILCFFNQQWSCVWLVDALQYRHRSEFLSRLRLFMRGSDCSNDDIYIMMQCVSRKMSTFLKGLSVIVVVVFVVDVLDMRAMVTVVHFPTNHL